MHLNANKVCDSAREKKKGTEPAVTTGRYSLFRGTHGVTCDSVGITYSNCACAKGIFSALSTASGGHSGFIEP